VAADGKLQRGATSEDLRCFASKIPKAQNIGEDLSFPSFGDTWWMISHSRGCTQPNIRREGRSQKISKELEAEEDLGHLNQRDMCHQILQS
jgi:hypothetical protein